MILTKKRGSKSRDSLPHTRLTHHGSHLLKGWLLLHRLCWILETRELKVELKSSTEFTRLWRPQCKSQVAYDQEISNKELTEIQDSQCWRVHLSAQWLEQDSWGKHIRSKTQFKRCQSKNPWNMFRPSNTPVSSLKNISSHLKIETQDLESLRAFILVAALQTSTRSWTKLSF